MVRKGGLTLHCNELRYWSFCTHGKCWMCSLGKGVSIYGCQGNGGEWVLLSLEGQNPNNLVHGVLFSSKIMCTNHMCKVYVYIHGIILSQGCKHYPCQC